MELMLKPLIKYKYIKAFIEGKHLEVNSAEKRLQLAKSMPKQFLFHLFLLCDILKLNYSKKLEAWKPFSSEAQTLPFRVREDAGSDVNIFDGIRFGLKTVVNRYSTGASNTNSTLQHRHGIFGLRRPPLKRLRMRLKKRTKNTSFTAGGQPSKVVVPFEPIQIVDTGLNIIGTVVEPTELSNMTTNLSNLESISHT